MIVEKREFIVVDPAMTTNPSSDPSAFAWCTMANEVCTVERIIQRRWETLDLAKEVFSAACPTDYCLGIAGHFISTIYIEGVGTFETLKKSIVAHSPKNEWDIRSIGGHSDNIEHAKLLRIKLAHEDYSADRIRLNNSMISQEIKRALCNQLLAKDNKHQDSDGHDDLADLLGLIAKVMHEDPPPVKSREEQNNKPWGKHDGEGNGGDDGSGGRLPGTY